MWPPGSFGTRPVWSGVGREKIVPPAVRVRNPSAPYFTTVEINSSYYGPPRPETVCRWVNSVSHNRNFRFTSKLFHSFTHERKPEPADERDYKEELGRSLRQACSARFLFSSHGHSKTNA